MFSLSRNFFMNPQQGDITSEVISNQETIEFNDLPIEYIAKIFEHLNFIDILSVRFVCKKWFKAVIIVCDRPIKIWISDKLESQLAHRAHFKFVDLIMFNNITSIKFFCLPTDKEMSPYEYDMFSDNSNNDGYFNKLIRVFLNTDVMSNKFLVENLIIKLLKMNRFNLKEIEFTGKSLNLFKKYAIFENILQIIANNCSNLKKIISNGYPDVDVNDPNGRSPAQEFMPNEFNVFLHQLQDRLEFLEVFHSNDKLSQIEFCKLKTFKNKHPDSIVKLIKQNSIFQFKLINLEITIPLDVTILEIVNLLSARCPKLQSLKLYQHHHHPNQSIIGQEEKLSSVLDIIAANFSHLHTLNINSFNFSTFELNNLAICNLLGNLPKIQSLKFHFSDIINANLLKMIVAPNLQILELSKIDLITAKQLSFLKDFPQLREAHFPDAKLICESEIDARSVGQTICQCRHLKYLQFLDFDCTQYKNRNNWYREIILDEYEKNIKKKYEFKLEISDKYVLL